MITIQDNNDIHGRKTLRIEGIAKDNLSRWDMTLLTSDLPDSFINLAPGQERFYDLSIVEADMRKSDDHPQTIFMPVALIGVSRTSERTRYYWESKLNSNNPLAPSLTLYAYTDKPAGEAGDPQVNYDLNEPYLRIAFAVTNENGERIDLSAPQGLRFESSQFSGNDTFDSDRIARPIQDSRVADLPGDPPGINTHDGAITQEDRQRELQSS
jgi:hypothetical protein